MATRLPTPKTPAVKATPLPSATAAAAAAPKARPSRAASPAAKAAPRVTPNTAPNAAPKATAPLKSAQPAKPVKPVKAAKPAKPAKATKAEKPAKLQQKPVRDSFTMPEADFSLVATLKARALAGKRETKKSELLRAGLHALAAMDGPTLLAALHALEPIKTGRPKKGH